MSNSSVASTTVSAVPSSRDGACFHLTGKTLTGSKGGKWKVLKRLEPKPDSTGGTFSVGYVVEDEAGKQYFMKASDTGLLSDGGNNLDKFTDAMNQQRFERQILDFCRGNNMDRIVHARDYGDFSEAYKGQPYLVFFIIFELASSDARSAIDRSKGLDFVWSLHALHNLSVAVQQLHTKGVTHNDIKPSNLLVFDKALQKLADMGRATHNDIIGPFDAEPCPGDFAYASPESIYHLEQSIVGKKNIKYRQASDLYLVGSMSYFFMTGVPLTTAIFTILHDEQTPINWTGTFEEVLPYWRDAFGKAMEAFRAQLPVTPFGRGFEPGNELLLATRQLCEPDPMLRGHPKNRGQNLDQYGIERYVTLFESLFQRAQILFK